MRPFTIQCAHTACPENLSTEKEQALLSQGQPTGSVGSPQLFPKLVSIYCKELAGRSGLPVLTLPSC